MTRVATIIALFFLSCVCAPFSYAADIMEARTSLASGHYDQAFETASQIGNPEALLLGAEALNTKILLGQSANSKKDAKKAMAIAESILATDPTNPDAKLLYAISYGFYGRSVSPLKAWRKKIPQKIEVAILDAVATNPDNANSYALYAGWHLGVCAKAGLKRADRMFGASIEAGIANFEKALSLSPDDMMINANYGLMLFAMGAETSEAKIDHLFSNIADAQPQNSAEIFVQKLVSDVAAQRSTPKTARKTAEDFLGW